MTQTSITEAVATVIWRAHHEHRVSVHAATMRLLVDIGGPERLLERPSLHSRGEGRDVLHELVLDGALVVWQLARQSRRWDVR